MERSRIDPRHPIDPTPIEELGQWDWGLHPDSIIRSVAQGEAGGLSNYTRIFRQMSNDRFMVKAPLTALRHFDVFEQGRGAAKRTLH